ncbi:MAG: type II secretion system protein [Candidatus Brocadiia bacterium]|jgi:prepilin-type N-terminal cleavage/methylation domain-containing protein
MTPLPNAEYRGTTARHGMRGRHSASRRAGFTLVEVLASLTVVLIALPVAMEAITLSNATATRARRQLEAANLAASKLAELVATNQWQNGNSSGDFSNYSTSFPDYTWTSTVTQYQEATTATTAAVTSTSGTTLGGGTGLSGTSASTPGSSSTPGSTLGNTSLGAGSTMGSTTALAVTLQELDVTVSWPGHTASSTPFSITLSTLIYPGLGST